MSHPLFVGLAIVVATTVVGLCVRGLGLMLQIANAVERLESNQHSHDDRITDLEKWRDNSKDQTIERLRAEKKALEMELAEVAHLG